MKKHKHQSLFANNEEEIKPIASILRSTKTSASNRNSSTKAIHGVDYNSQQQPTSCLCSPHIDSVPLLPINKKVTPYQQPIKTPIISTSWQRIKNNNKKKIFVVDTNVFLFDPMAIYHFAENDIVIPNIVMEEIDNFKSEQNERGCNAREFARQLLKICDKAAPGESLKNGIHIGPGLGKVRIGTEIIGYENVKADKVILVATKQERSNSSCPVVLVTKDIMLRVTANAEEIPAEDYKYDKVVDNDGIYLGRTKIWIPYETLENFHKNKIAFDVNTVKILNSNGEHYRQPFYENEFVEIYPCEGNTKSVVLGKYKNGYIVPLRYDNIYPSGINPLNSGQKFALEALLAPPDEAPLVILKGPAGTAKTLLSLASALEAYKGTNKKLGYSYNRILVSRPAVVLDEPLGFLPGTEEDKMSPFIRGLKDNMMVLHNYNNDLSPHEYNQAREDIDAAFYDMIDIESLSFLRGRSLHNYFAFFDEMQNASTSLVKTIITRAGSGTKIVLAGDVEQIDMLYLNSSYNGLTYASEKMKGSPLCYQVTMNNDECCRSKLAQDAAARMNDSARQKNKLRQSN